MKIPLKSPPWLWLTLFFILGAIYAAFGGTNGVDIRRQLNQAILTEGPEQQKLLGDLADSGSTIVRNVLSAWTRDGVYLYVAPDGSKTPVLLEDAQDANGKAQRHSHNGRPARPRRERKRVCGLAPATSTRRMWTCVCEVLSNRRLIRWPSRTPTRKPGNQPF